MNKGDLVAIPKGEDSFSIEAVVEEKPSTKMGRPTKFTPELGDEICELVGNGWSMRKVAKLDHMPEMRTIFQWLRVQPDFQQQYARAKTEETADAVAEKIQDISEGVLSGEYDPQAARVAIDAYKWTASKLKPKKYGDKIDMTTNGKDLPTPILGSVALPDTTNEIIDLE